jgi:hypothetical protein
VEEARRPVDNGRTARNQRVGGRSEGALGLFPFPGAARSMRLRCRFEYTCALLTGYFCVGRSLYGHAAGERRAVTRGGS